VKVVFWGSPDFAVPSLQALLDNRHQIVSVVTRPDRPAGRGRNLRRTAVKNKALNYDLSILEPESPSDGEFLRALGESGADVCVVVAYGKKLPRPILEMFPLGCINVHASLLPSLRGAAPINWAIIKGFKTSGVTVMRMVDEMDAGPILMQSQEEIGVSETAFELETRLAVSGARALTEVLESIESGSIKSREQDESMVTYAPKINKSVARIDWSQEATVIANMIRGMDKIPGAWSLLKGNPTKLFNAIPSLTSVTGSLPGTVLDANDISGLRVATGQGTLEIGEVQPSGKKRMSASSWIRGRGTEVGQRFQ
tara:strand:- start:28428 stop:29363 length:936 start_codon:yes stop_codon:yes gene_type:complete